MKDENSTWKQQVLVGVGMLIAVGLLVGGIVAWLGLKAADVAGITEAQPTTPAASSPDSGSGPSSPDQSTPSTTPPTTPTTPTETTPQTTQTTETTEGPTASPQGNAGQGGPEQPDKQRHTDKPVRPSTGLILNASPQVAGTYQRVNLTGSWQGHNGASLQVQRKESGSWVDFPTSASVSGGTFSTYVEMGLSGPNPMRVVNGAHTSNVVVVTIQ